MMCFAEKETSRPDCILQWSRVERLKATECSTHYYLVPICVSLLESAADYKSEMGPRVSKTVIFIVPRTRRCNRKSHSFETYSRFSANTEVRFRGIEAHCKCLHIRHTVVQV